MKKYNIEIVKLLKAAYPDATCSLDFKTPFEALAAGIGMVHQEFSLIPGFTATENILLNREPKKKSVISEIFGERLNVLNRKEMNQKAGAAARHKGSRSAHPRPTPETCHFPPCCDTDPRAFRPSTSGDALSTACRACPSFATSSAVAFRPRIGIPDSVMQITIGPPSGAAPFHSPG